MKVFLLFIFLLSVGNARCEDDFFVAKPALVPSSQKILEERADIVLRSCDVGLTKSQLVAAFRFIESHFKKKNKDIYTSKTTRLPCRIERCRPLHGYIIRKIRRKAALIGRGCHKIAMKTILYSSHPKVLVECISDCTAKREIRTLHKVRGAAGVVPYFGAVKRGAKYSIFLEYFGQGSLYHHVSCGKSISEPELYKIALDVSKGLHALHKNGMVHRDLHAGNVLLNISSTYCKAALADFGQTLPIHQARGTRPQAARHKNPPEALICLWSKLDRKKVDMYALGCLFYELLWRKRAPWSEVFNAPSFKECSRKAKKKMYRKMLSRYNEEKKLFTSKLLAKKSAAAPLTKLDAFNELIFRMTDYSPKNRPLTKEVIAFLEKLQSE